jgi:PP-loop superfamily ATP-utilizing enzyme
MQVAVAMSGGVDSSLVAKLMCEKYGRDNLYDQAAGLVIILDTQTNTIVDG